MTGRRLRIAALVVVAFFALRSWVFPAQAPAWLRGTSPFTWTETRAERKRCLTFGEMMGARGRTIAYADDDRTSDLTVEIDRTRRVGDSLVFEGRARRGRTVQILFHCATANVRGRPGEHHTVLSQPWAGVPEEWEPVHALEARIERQCADSAVRFFPTSRISPKMLILRSIPFGAEVHAMAIDTVYEVEPQEFVCIGRTTDGEIDEIRVLDPARAAPQP